MAEKRLFWLGSSLENVRAFPKEARRAAGHQLDLVQHGLEPSDWKPHADGGDGSVRDPSPCRDRVSSVLHCKVCGGRLRAPRIREADAPDPPGRYRRGKKTAQ